MFVDLTHVKCDTKTADHRHPWTHSSDSVEDSIPCVVARIASPSKSHPCTFYATTFIELLVYRVDHEIRDYLHTVVVIPHGKFCEWLGLLGKRLVSSTQNVSHIRDPDRMLGGRDQAYQSGCQRRLRLPRLTLHDRLPSGGAERATIVELRNLTYWDIFCAQTELFWRCRIPSRASVFIAAGQSPPANNAGASWSSLCWEAGHRSRTTLRMHDPLVAD